MTTKQIIYAILIFGLFLSSCKPKVTIENSNGNKIELNAENFEFTSSEKEDEKERLIIEEVQRFLKVNKSDAVLNYLYLCDSSIIETHRTYQIKHKQENISIRNRDVRLTPIPSSYKISEGPIASYKIINDSLGKLSSYFLDLKIDENYKITSFKGTLRFMKEKDGVNKLSFKKDINPDEKYLMENKIKTNSW